MTLLVARCPRDHLARITIDDAALQTVAVGNSIIEADLDPGLYQVAVSARGHRVEQLVRLDESTQQSVELSPPPRVSPVPDHQSPHHVDAVSRASRSLSEAQPETGLVVVARRISPSANGAPLTTEAPSRLSLSTSENVVGLVGWRSDPVETGDLAIWSAPTPRGVHALVSSAGVAPAMAVPTWPHWQTIVFMPWGDDGPIPNLATVLSVPMSSVWNGRDEPTELMLQLLDGLQDPAAISRAGVLAVERDLVNATGSFGPSPIARLALGHLGAFAGVPDIWARQRQGVAQFGPVAAADLRALDEQLEGRPPEVTGSSRPIFAASADGLLSSPSALSDRLDRVTSEEFAARLASPVWFRWSFGWAATTLSSTATVPRDPDPLGSLGALRPTLFEIEELRDTASELGDAGASRLLSYVADECVVRGLTPADVLPAMSAASVAERTGVPRLALDPAASRSSSALSTLRLPPAQPAPPPPPPAPPEAAYVAPTEPYAAAAAAPVAAGGRQWWWWVLGFVLVAVIVTVIVIAIIDGDDVGDEEGGSSDEPVATSPPPPDTTLPPDVPGFSAFDDRAVVAENGEVSIDVLANDEIGDIDVAIEIIDVPVNGDVVVSGATITYSPFADFVGADSFRYAAVDGDGRRAEASVGIEVEADETVNQPPTASDDAVATPEDESVGIDVLENDENVDRDDLSLRVVGEATFGTAVVSGGLVEYTPDENANGTDSFTYEISDGDGGTSAATVTVQVEPVADPPIAQDDAVETVTGEPVTIRVLANDSDADGDPLTVELVQAPELGDIQLNDDGTFTYDDTATYVGTHEFTYTVSDGTFESEPATVTITVFPTVGLAGDVDGVVTVEEEDAPTIDIELSAPWDEPIEVDYVVTPDTAVKAPPDLATGDYDIEPATGTLTIEPDVRAVPLVEIVNDSSPEISESFFVDLTVRYPGGLERSTAFTVTIANDDVIE